MKKKIKTNKTKQKAHTQKHGVILFWLLPGLEPAPRCGWYPVALHWRTPDFPFPIKHQLQIASWLGVLGRTLSTSLSQPWDFSGLNLCRSCECCHSLCVHVSQAVSGGQCSLQGRHPWFFLSFHLFFYIDPRGEGFDTDIPFTTECSKLSHSARCPVAGLCVNYCLLQE